MSLDLRKVSESINSLTASMKNSVPILTDNLNSIVKTFEASDPVKLRNKQEKSFDTYDFPLPAGITESFANKYSLPEIPEGFSVVSADGSDIDVDRHLPVRVYVINVGGCIFTYGETPNAELRNEPKLYGEYDDLYLTDSKIRTRETPIQGTVLGLKRTVEEAKFLAQMTENSDETIPTLSLMDGSLMMWGFLPKGDDLVRDVMLKDGLISELDRIYQMSRNRTLAVASYISLPGATEVINALRMHDSFCPYEVSHCSDQCGSTPPNDRPCMQLNNLMDRTLFERTLAPGERSALFYSTSSVVQEHYGVHKIYFFYVNVGEEIGRVEVPEWVAFDKQLLDLTHGLIVDQCRRGFGYPVSLAEAHEQAVIGQYDRESFKELIDVMLTTHKLPVYTSRKNRSKRLRYL